jgi:CheY-like chemotaxis protein
LLLEAKDDYVSTTHREGRAMKKKILVVEDNEDNRRILVYRLRKIGEFEILEAQNGLEAIEMTEKHVPDLIFMDLKMPVMDGWEATKRIRQTDVGSRVAIIALTAQAMAGDEQKALAIGCDDYLAKPVVDPELVRTKLERLLNKYSPSVAAPLQ